MDELSFFEPCLGQPNVDHDDFGFCQAGTSMDVSRVSDILRNDGQIYVVHPLDTAKNNILWST